MIRLLLCLLLAGISLPVVAIAEEAKVKAIQKDRKRIEGRWRATELVVNGKEQDAKKVLMINGPDGSWRLLSKGKEISKGTSIISPTTKPKTIDFTVTEGEGGGNHYLGIYELGDTHRKLAFAPADKGRPTGFASRPDSGHVLVEFEREGVRVRNGEQQDPAASADAEVLTNSDLLRINKLFLEAHEFIDNEFIYEEKLNEAIENASKLAEGPLNVTNVLVEVNHIGKEIVKVAFFAEEETHHKPVPQIRFVEARDADVQFDSSIIPVGIGGTLVSGHRLGRLKVGPLVPVPLAKMLRAGDRVKITGTLIEVQPVDLNSLPRRQVAGFVILAAGVERVSLDDSEADE